MNAHTSQILAGLNAPQRAAVVSESPRLLVLAGAGSGKTRVLTHRIAWSIEQDCISPHSVLAVTFTNKAAAEMRARLEKLIGVSASGMWVGTFHGIAHRLLRHHWEEAKLPQNFQILDADDQLRMVKRAQKTLDLDDEKWPPKQSVGVINGWKDEGLRPKHIDASDFFSQTLKKIYETYQDMCERAGSVDFNELLLRALELWRDNEHLRAHYQNRFKLILVDEFQDTNTIQYAWLQLLASPHNKITIVGDDDQSIYGWRGAKIENIQQFHQDFAGAEIIRLEQNYRSTGTILKAANAVIAQNSNRLGKQLWTQGTDGEPISVYAGFNEVDEARFIVDRVRDITLKGHARAEIAILYRSNAQSRVL
ncbi:MAG TPA: UvrD-helicase domain-containing protein, partial [Pseudomonadales bacterium]|nr:UvrD-helicase domain-containing protein [Pseudomonadales bacterium]